MNRVFSGKNALLDFHNPDKNPPTPMVELPEHPFTAQGIRIYAKMMNFLPATNVKSLPALNMLQEASRTGRINEETTSIVEYSSGSTAISLGMIAQMMGIDRAEIYISNKTSEAKIKMLRLFGLELTVFGGPSQPAPDDPIGGIAAARTCGMKPGCFNPNQYENPQNYEAHEKWTGPQIYDQLPQIGVFSASVGTSGTMTGTSRYLKGVKPGITVIGTFTAPGQRIPGPRTLALIEPVQFPWKDTIDEIVEIGTREAFDQSLLLCRMGIVVGPSSGMSLAAVYSFLKRRKAQGTLDELRDEHGEITCVFLCCDFPFQYLDEYMEKCSPGSFPPIHNEELLKVDLNPYLTTWEWTPLEAFEMIFAHRMFESKFLLLDFRHPVSFQASSILDSVSVDVGLGLSDPNPFNNPTELSHLHHQLDKLFQPPNGQLCALLDASDLKIVAICQNGTASRTATSVMRSKGIEAYCIKGGINAWHLAGLPLKTAVDQSSVKKNNPQCQLSNFFSNKSCTTVELLQN